MTLREMLIPPMQHLVAARDNLRFLAEETPEHAATLNALADAIETPVLDHVAGFAQELRRIR